MKGILICSRIKSKKFRIINNEYRITSKDYQIMFGINMNNLFGTIRTPYRQGHGQILFYVHVRYIKWLVQAMLGMSRLVHTGFRTSWKKYFVNCFGNVCKRQQNHPEKPGTTQNNSEQGNKIIMQTISTVSIGNCQEAGLFSVVLGNSAYYKRQLHL